MQINLKALCEEVGVKFYDEELVSENGRKIYRIYIIKQGGVKLGDCERLSAIVSPLFDVTPPCEGEYFLEVSSPGLERKLTKPSHFMLSVGEMVQITDKDKQKFLAKILSADEKQVHLQNEEQGEFKLCYDEIKKAKTFVAW